LVPQLNGPYTPAIIAMMIGFMGNQMPSIFSAIVAKIKGKAGI
jgi:hypothetical protein